MVSLPSTQTLEELLSLAREDLNRNQLSTAEKNLEQAILLNNQSPEAFNLLGHVYTKKGKFKKAILAFKKSLVLDPSHTEAAIALSSLQNDVGNYKEAAIVYQNAKRRLENTQPGFDPRINQALAKSHFTIGVSYMKFERFLEAHHEFSKSFQLDPENNFSAIQMARCLSKTGNKEWALNLLKKATESHPKDVGAKIQLGILYHSLKKLKEAYRQWSEALLLDPENKSAQMYLSMFEYETPIAGITSQADGYSA